MAPSWSPSIIQLPDVPLNVRTVDIAGLTAHREALIGLLIDTVEHGASVGFVLPLPRAEAGAYWDGLQPTIANGTRLLWFADDEAGLLGTVQIELTFKKARVLMSAVELRARELDRGLLYLDTEAGCGAEPFYRSAGYSCIGGLPEYACSPEGEWRANAIYYKTLFKRGAT